MPKKPEINHHLKAHLMQVVDNQLELPETKFVKDKFEALSSKYGALRAKEMIAAVVVGEIYDMQMEARTFDNVGYKRLIEGLE